MDALIVRRVIRRVVGGNRPFTFTVCRKSCSF